ncbi:MAG TPA: hypothetical protein VNA30_07315 [Mycobacteriales bacterium]|nr:hypothetical protein [Mycobacteriales bacterium]
MRRLALSAAAAVCLAGVVALPSKATPPEPGPGYVKTSNVSHLLTLPLDTDSIGGRVFGKDFFLRTAKGVTIYDTSNPAIPVPKGFVAVPATPNQEREDIDTNGKILVTGQSMDGTLYIIDVRNRLAPTILSILRGAADHTNTCVLDCTFVYGSSGEIVDLRDPANPKRAGNWLRGTGVGGSHDLTEVKPGLLVVASNPVAYIDARKPLTPKRITTGRLPDSRYTHGTAWPRGGNDRFVLGGSESGYGCFQPEDGTFFVFDTKKKAKEGGWTRTGDYTIAAGLPTEGKAPTSELCGHWFDPHPDFKDGGMVAMAWYGFGVRFLEVTKAGAVKERGFWQPLPGHSSAAYWVSKDTVWVTDYTARGLDVLKFDASKPAAIDAAHPGRFRAAQAGDEARARAAGRGPEHAAAHHNPDGSLSELAKRFVCRA